MKAIEQTSAADSSKGFSKANVVLLLVGALALISDGFDVAVIGYVGPELVKEWKVAPAQLGPIFSAGIIGLLVGAPLFGLVGDRYGRKRAIVLGLCLFGVLSLVTMWASTLTEIALLRFLTSIGLGGVIPNVIALTAEGAPRRLRGTFIAMINFGVILGFALPGLAASLLVPQYGWRALVALGGLLPLTVALLAASLLVESSHYTALRSRQIAAPGAPRGTLSPRRLFEGGLAFVTPTLWLALAANQMVNFFALSWLPTLLQSAGASTAQAGVTASMYGIGGLFGGLLITALIDRFGYLPAAVLFLLGVPFVAALGMSDLDPVAFRFIAAGAGFCTTGINFGMNVALGTLYPTAVRSSGTGWGQAVGRIGSLAAPILGSMLLTMHLPLQKLLLIPAMVLLVGGLGYICFLVFCRRQFGGWRIPTAEGDGEKTGIAGVQEMSV